MLNSNERIRMLGFPSQYLVVNNSSPEDVRCELAGDAMSVQVLVRILATLPEQPGAWPPLKLSCSDQGLVVDHEQGSPSKAEDSPGVTEWTGIALTSRLPRQSDEAEHEAEPTVVHDGSPLWAIEGQQWLTSKQLGKARWVCVNLSGPGPFGLVPRATNTDTRWT